MPRFVIDGFPEDLLRELKIKAATENTSVKALLIAAAEKLLGKKAATK
jgi:plasmid stability protein